METGWLAGWQEGLRGLQVVCVWGGGGVVKNTVLFIPCVTLLIRLTYNCCGVSVGEWGLGWSGWEGAGGTKGGREGRKGTSALNIFFTHTWADTLFIPPQRKLRNKI